MTTGRPTDLTRDERGAVLVVGLFLTTVLFGMVFYVVGLGTAIGHGETLQDASDGGAYTAAVMGARGMNLMVLMNMVKVSVTAIAAGMLAIVAGALATIAWIKAGFFRRIIYGWTIPFLSIVAFEAGTHYLDKQSTFDDILDAADAAQDALRDDLMLAAELRASEAAGSFAGVDGGFLAPVRSLPVDELSTFDTCLRAAPLAAPIIDESFDSVPSGRVRGRARRYSKGAFPGTCLLLGTQARRLSDGVEVGDEEFQQRFYARGEQIRDNEDSGVRVATWRRDEGGGNVARLREALSQVGVAQAEFYFDGTAATADVLWQMRWRARMRRFRDVDGFAAFGSACNARGIGMPCAVIRTALSAASDLIVH